MLRNNCHPRKVITYAIVYTHNRLWMHVLRGGEENPACTLGVCALYCVRMPQIAFELLPITVDFPDVCVCVCVREGGGEGEFRSEEGDCRWKAVGWAEMAVICFSLIFYLTATSSGSDSFTLVCLKGLFFLLGICLLMSSHISFHQGLFTLWKYKVRVFPHNVLLNALVLTTALSTPSGQLKK